MLCFTIIFVLVTYVIKSICWKWHATSHLFPTLHSATSYWYLGFSVRSIYTMGIGKFYKSGFLFSLRTCCQIFTCTPLCVYMEMYLKDLKCNLHTPFLFPYINKLLLLLLPNYLFSKAANKYFCEVFSLWISPILNITRVYNLTIICFEWDTILQRAILLTFPLFLGIFEYGHYHQTAASIKMSNSIFLNFFSYLWISQ